MVFTSATRIFQRCLRLCWLRGGQTLIEIYPRLNLTINLPNLMLESYYQLVFMLKVPYQALKKGHHLVLLSFVVFSLAGIVAPMLQSALFDVDILPADGTLWTAKVGTNMAYARAVQAVHGVVIVLIIALAALLHRRRNTGLYADPDCVAALAAIVGSTLRKDLANLDPADERTILNTISRRRYHLHHKHQE